MIPRACGSTCIFKVTKIEFRFIGRCIGEAIEKESMF